MVHKEDQTKIINHTTQRERERERTEEHKVCDPLFFTCKAIA